MHTDDIDNRFDYHPPSEKRATMHDTVRNSLKHVAYQMDTTLPDSREKSLTLTHLEEAMFWANAAIARHVHG